jgi:hypothetical protein
MKSPPPSSAGDPLGSSSELRKLLSGFLKRRVTSLRHIGGGRNSRIFRVSAPPGPSVAAKFFVRNTEERRRRSGVEFDAFRFLWDRGERCIPRPISLHPDQSCALYEFVDGRPVPPGEVRGEDIDRSAAFLGRLKEIAGSIRQDQAPPAAEACFSIDEIEENLQLRLERLLTLPDREAPYPQLRTFLTERFRATAAKALAQARRRQKGAPPALPKPDRTLSPSDFGFHNSIRRPDGSLVFVDFEYFGWDDPAKTISDFLLHPAMRLRSALQRRFVQGAFSVYGADANLAKRVESFYPLFGLKWCLILLNEFVPQDLTRRTFAGADALAPAAARRRQLARAQRLLARINEIRNGRNQLFR